MLVAVGISLIVVLGIWALQLKQTVLRVRPQGISDAVRAEWRAAQADFSATFREPEQDAAAPVEAPQPGSPEFDPAAVERLSEELKTESQ